MKLFLNSFLASIVLASPSCSSLFNQKPPVTPPTKQNTPPPTFTPTILGDTLCQFSLVPGKPKVVMDIPVHLPAPPSGHVWKISLITPKNATNDTSISCTFPNTSIPALSIDQPAPLTDPNNPSGSSKNQASYTQSSPAPLDSQAVLSLSTKFADTHFRQRISLVAIPVASQ